jgi:hypothetical protein
LYCHCTGRRKEAKKKEKEKRKKEKKRKEKKKKKNIDTRIPGTYILLDSQ